MRKGKKIVLLGAIMALMGMCRLFVEERAMAKHRCKQGMGWTVFGFGMAFLWMSGWMFCRRKWMKMDLEVD
ncbi:hypothetical protein [Marininema halotolerans]|uniref:Uncharacterized protein n=1 Tax=Marininema halotolerans TaxID=1155944 RepID=A0A1I6RNE0_9BACL|nr:hypothetical protein [Marininema halotolerans]SFS66263.1 hypothetical protein SAMN05444972_105237 [Marininema halotolerans]